MISIDMYNEGIHIPDLDGVIMGRNTKSDIVFFQQLGRALAVKMKENYNPLILDLAGNIREIIKLYKSVRKKGQSRAFPQNTTASDNYFRNIFGISQEVIDIIEEFDGLKEKFISKNVLIDRINYIYDTYKEKKIPTQNSIDRFPDGIGGAKIGSFLANKNNKDRILALANIGNQKALWIIQQLDERRNLTDDEKDKQLIDRINYIYDTYKEKRLPVQGTTDRFPDGIGGTKIGGFLAHKKNKDRILALANIGNQKALWIIQQFDNDKQLIDRIDYLYDTYKKKKLPTQGSTDRFPDAIGSAKIGIFLNSNKDSILALANIGNQKALWIIQQLNESRHLTDEEKDKQLIDRINYIYDTYKDKGVPKHYSTDRFPDAIGSAKIGPFLAHKNNKDSILALANIGNQKALWICQQKKWIKIVEAKQKFEESSNFKELKDNLDGKSKDDSKNLS